MSHKNKNGVSKYIKKLKKIWDQRDVIIVEGEKSRVGIGNDLFNNVKTIKRIICPYINAFNMYNDIINSITRNVQKNKLILIALGPTATLLAYDLYKLGYQSIDIGHIDIEYEWYLRKTKTKIKIENKYVSEVLGNDRFSRVKDKKYYDSIIERIY
jgi:glycosyltransferase family protein